jgi:hypothetical protein
LGWVKKTVSENLQVIGYLKMDRDGFPLISFSNSSHPCSLDAVQVTIALIS